MTDQQGMQTGGYPEGSQQAKNGDHRVIGAGGADGQAFLLGKGIRLEVIHGTNSLSVK
jgi:hypothetical protein